MKKYILPAIILLVLGCKKKNALPTYAVESFPQRVVMAMEIPNDNTFYDYFSAQGTVVRRAAVEKNDAAVERLFSSAHAPDCVWIAMVENNLIYFQLESASSTYMKAVPNRISDEYLLVASTKSNDNAHLFKRHFLRSDNGARIVVLESVMYPNYYLSREGVLGENNSIKLVQKANLKDAKEIRWYGRIM